MASTLRSTTMASKSVLNLTRSRILVGQNSRLRLTSPVLRSLSIRPTQSLKKEYEDDHRAHTITERLKQVKKIPVELIPIAVVLAFAVLAAAYALVHTSLRDKTLRWHKKEKKEY